jgi:hypothetical protein
LVLCVLCAAGRANLTEGNVTLALVARVSPDKAQWLALGVSSDAGGMKGMDVAMLWTQVRTEDMRVVPILIHTSHSVRIYV